MTNVAMIGLGFGAEFIPIYQSYPGANVHAICRRDEAELSKVGDQFGIERRYTDYDHVLADPDVDYVHINTPIPDHAWMSLAALDAGKHVMCTVPMATTVEDCRKIVEKVAETGLRYMMAETVVYSREFLFIKELYEKGELGDIQHLAASHPQDMDGWPSYWERMIPMHYATHVVSPCLGLVDGLAEYVSCFGSGAVRDDIAEKSGNRFAVETCHIKVKDSELVAHIWRFLYDVARQYRESFDVYGTKKSFEWTLIEDEPHVLHTAKKPEHEIPGEDRGARLRAPPAGTDPALHPAPGDPRRGAPFLHPGRRTRRLPPPSRARVPERAQRRPRSLAERGHQRQLDLRRHLRPRVGAPGRPDRPATRLHVRDVTTSEPTP